MNWLKVPKKVYFKTGCYPVALKEISGLNHSGEFVMLRFNVRSVDVVEFAYYALQSAHNSCPERFLLGYTVLGMAEHGCREAQHSQYGAVRKHQNFPKMRSMTQLTGVADTLVQLHTLIPCRCSITALMMGNCTYGGLGTVMELAPALVTSWMGL